MDVVSDAISAAHLGHPWYHRVRTSGSWCARVDAYDRTKAANRTLPPQPLD
jgi:hypothetical protein